MIPGEIRTPKGRSSSARPGPDPAGRGEHRRPAGPGRLALPFRRRPTRRCASTAPRPGATGWTSRPARRSGSSRAWPGEVDARRRWPGRGWCPGCAAEIRQGRWMAELSRGRGTPPCTGRRPGDRIRLADTDLLIEVDRGPCGGPAGPATRPSSAAARSSASRWARRSPPGPRARPTWSSPARSSSTTGASSRPTSASATAGSSRSARPATPTSWTASTPAWSSARPPRSSRATG